MARGPRQCPQAAQLDSALRLHNLVYLDSALRLHSLDSALHIALRLHSLPRRQRRVGLSSLAWSSFVVLVWSTYLVIVWISYLVIAKKGEGGEEGLIERPEKHREEQGKEGRPQE